MPHWRWKIFLEQAVKILCNSWKSTQFCVSWYNQFLFWLLRIKRKVCSAINFCTLTRGEPFSSFWGERNMGETCAQSRWTRGFSTEWWILAIGLVDLLGIADLHCWKVKSTRWLKTQTDWMPIVWTNQLEIWVSFSHEVCQGTARIWHAGLWGFSEALFQWVSQHHD